MNLLVFWNELAERPLAAGRFEANGRMNSFIDTLGALRRATPGSRPLLRSHVPLHGVDLAESYTIARWQVETDQARRGLFLQLATSAPLLQAPDDRAEAMERYDCADCFHQGDRAIGLRAAWAAGEIAVSLDSDERWRRSSLDVEIERILDSSGALGRSGGVVRHLSVVSHVDAHLAWLRERQHTTVLDGRDLWRRRVAVFPTLVFCREVEGQLTTLDASHLRQVVRRLLELAAAFAGWDRRPFGPGFVPSKCSPETKQTLIEEADDHTATKPDGTRHLFSWHVRYTPGAGRIFFDGDPKTGHGLVGYVGPKKGSKLS